MTRIIRWLGLVVVLAAAAVLSFHGLRDLALAVSIPVELAWLLPIAVDAGAAVSCACWLARELAEDAQRFARSMTWGLLGLTVVGNAAQLGMHAAALTPPWWVAVAVGAIPPAVVGGTVHLAVLVGRASGDDGRPDEEPAAWDLTVPPADAEVVALMAHRTPPGTGAPPFRPVPGGPAGEQADGQASTGEPGDETRPLPDRRTAVDTSSVAAIADDLRAIAGEHGRPLTQDEVKAVYGIGTDKASRARRLLGWWPRAVEQASTGGAEAGA